MYVALRESGPLSTLLILLGPDEKAPGTNIWFVSFALAPSSSSARAKMNYFFYFFISRFTSCFIYLLVFLEINLWFSEIWILVNVGFFSLTKYGKQLQFSPENNNPQIEHENSESHVFDPLLTLKQYAKNVWTN